MEPPKTHLVHKFPLTNSINYQTGIPSLLLTSAYEVDFQSQGLFLGLCVCEQGDTSYLFVFEKVKFLIEKLVPLLTNLTKMFWMC